MKDDKRIGRRTFMQVSAASVAGAAVSAAPQMTHGAEAASLPVNHAKDDITTRIEVLVIGGGTAGTVAGATAALAMQNQTTLLRVPLAEIHALLRQHGAIVPGAA